MASERESEVRTTIRLSPEVHRVVRAACSLAGETLSEFIARVGQQELDRLVRERQQRDREVITP
jgi:uncharacterized protein (DUF1778 family)